MVTFDEAKNAANIAKHGVSLALAVEMDLDDAVIVPSDRNGETRFVAYGLIDATLFALVFTFRGETVRVMSLRPASRRERKRYTA